MEDYSLADQVYDGGNYKAALGQYRGLLERAQQQVSATQKKIDLFEKQIANCQEHEEEQFRAILEEAKREKSILQQRIIYFERQIEDCQKKMK